MAQQQAFINKRLCKQQNCYACVKIKADMSMCMSVKAQSGDDRRGTVQPQSDFSEHAQCASQYVAKATVDHKPFTRGGTHNVSMNSSGRRANLLSCLQMLFFSVFSLLALWLHLYLLQLTTLMDPAGHMQR